MVLILVRLKFLKAIKLSMQCLRSVDLTDSELPQNNLQTLILWGSFERRLCENYLAREDLGLYVNTREGLGYFY